MQQTRIRNYQMLELTRMAGSFRLAEKIGSYFCRYIAGNEVDTRLIQNKEIQ